MEDRVVVHEFLSSYLSWYFFFNHACCVRHVWKASCMLCCAPCMEEYQESDF